MSLDINQNLGNLMKEAQKMQQRMQDAQQQLSELVVEGKAGGITLSMDGQHRVRSLTISPAARDEDTEFLCDVIIAAFNDAGRKIEEASKNKIAELTSGLNIPTDFLNDKDGNDK